MVVANEQLFHPILKRPFFVFLIQLVPGLIEFIRVLPMITFPAVYFLGGDEKWIAIGVFSYFGILPSVLCNGHHSHWSCKARIARKDYEVGKTRFLPSFFYCQCHRNFSLCPFPQVVCGQCTSHTLCEEHAWYCQCRTLPSPNHAHQWWWPLWKSGFASSPQTAAAKNRYCERRFLRIRRSLRCRLKGGARNGAGKTAMLVQWLGWSWRHGGHPSELCREEAWWPTQIIQVS